MKKRYIYKQSEIDSINKQIKDIKEDLMKLRRSIKADIEDSDEIWLDTIISDVDLLELLVNGEYLTSDK